MGILGGQKIKSPGNVMNCPENQYICFYPSHPRGGGVPGGGGGWGLKFQKSGKFHELSRKSIKKKLPPPTKGGRSGNFRGSENQKSGKCHELSRKSIQFVFTHPTRGGSSRGGGGWGGQNFKSQVNFMNCRENR